MGLREFLASLRLGDPSPAVETSAFTIVPDHDGANFIIDAESFAQLKRGVGSRTVQEQFVVLRMLVEDGAARELPNGFEMSTRDVARLGDEEADVLGLPQKFSGEFVTKVTGHTNSSRFQVRLRASVGEHPEPWARTGPELKVGTSKIYRLSTPALLTLEAIEDHERLSPDTRTESDNVELIARLQNAKAIASQGEEGQRDPHFTLDLHHFDNLETVTPDKVGLTAERQRDGSLLISPNLGTGDGLEQLERRWRQLDPKQDTGVIRVGKKLILLDAHRTAGVKEVLSNRRIPAAQVKDFLEAPGAFFDPNLVDMDFGFSIRVKGVGAIVPVSFNDAASSGLDWFDAVESLLQPRALDVHMTTLDEFDWVNSQVAAAWERGDAVLTIDGDLYDIRDREEVESVLADRRSELINEEKKPATSDELGRRESSITVGVVMDEVETAADQLRSLALAATPERAVEFSDLKRTPFPHQREGVEWMVALMQTSLAGADDSSTRVQGAILADDMGLGKTYMAVVALKEFLAAQARQRQPNRPILAVLPLSLVENWEQEIIDTFSASPFTDVVVLQSARDLSAFKISGSGRETKTSAGALDDDGMMRADAIRLSLRVGAKHGVRRLDMPGRLVLTTYETLADYQLSLSQIDWGVVVFDEAQNIKNPDALRTRAAKGLKARFKLLATGTPVENSLMDLWSLVDTAQPGLLGSWPEFEKRWVKPEEAGSETGPSLRAHIGPFMLRRNKEDHLPDLPSKTIHSGVERPEDPRVRFDQELAVVMPEPQRAVYDEQLASFRASKKKTPGAALKVLQQLRSISLHPDATLSAGTVSDLGPAASARMRATLLVLDRVRDNREKAIVFVIDRNIQRRLALWLRERYQLPVTIVNGQTNAVSARGGATRRSLIREFEQVEGFNVIIMSPLAVGVGLTVVGANHAIHLERHWNPAKEAQATDRIYRIGQKKPVHVYLPMAFHPHLQSFDVNLDTLLWQKTELKDSVIMPEAVSERDLMATMGLVNS